MTFEKFKKKFESDPKFRKEKTDNFTYSMAYGITPKEFASMIKALSKGTIHSRQAKDFLKAKFKLRQEFVEENEKELGRLVKQ